MRDGTFDPFDLVGREGSSLRRELVEVDELFYTPKAVYEEAPAAAAVGTETVAGARAAEATGAGHVPDLGNLPVAVVRRGEDTSASARSADLVAGQGHLALAHVNKDTRSSLPAAPASRPPSGLQKLRPKRRDPKHFHIMDRGGRVTGPLSASEIQALFYKGVLEKHVQVMRDGSTAKVPVGKFVAMYSEARGQRPAQQGAHPNLRGAGAPRPMGMGLPRAMLRFRRQVRSPSPAAVIFLAAALVFSAAAVYLATAKGSRHWVAKLGHELSEVADGLKGASHGARPPRQERRRRGGEPHPTAAPAPRPAAPPVRPAPRRPVVPASALAPPAPTASLAPPSRVALETPAAARGARAEAAKEKRDAALKAQRDAQKTQREKQREKQKREQERLARERALAAKRAARPPAPGPRTTFAVTPVARPVPSPAAPVAMPAPAPAPAPKPAGPSVATLADGQQVRHLGPMSFDKGALASCTASCNVTFSGAGGSVQATFFKQAWGPTLESKGGGVYLSGLVRKSGGGTKIILSNVQ